LQTWRDEKIRLMDQLERAKSDLIYEQANSRKHDRELVDVKSAYEELKKQSDLFKKL
jgi:hypothetical protein